MRICISARDHSAGRLTDDDPVPGDDGAIGLVAGCFGAPAHLERTRHEDRGIRLDRASRNRRQQADQRDRLTSCRMHDGGLQVFENSGISRAAA